MRIRKIPIQAQVVVLALTTAPAPFALAAKPAPGPAREAAREEQVNVRIHGKRFHVAVRTGAGRHAALVAETGPGKYELLANAQAVAEADGVANIKVDLDTYEPGPAVVAVVTAADADFTQDLRATDAVELVLKDGTMFEPGAEPGTLGRQVGADAVKGLKGVRPGLEVATRSAKRVQMNEKRPK